MKPSLLNRRVHYWLSPFVALPLLVVAVTGVLLQVKKQVAWVQPAEKKGTGKEPSVSFDRVLAACRGVPEAGVTRWDDITRIDVRPSKGVLKVTTKSDWELQVDAATGDVLQSAYRRSDWIEAMHDGSYFSDWAKYGWVLPAGLGLAALCLSGAYLFWQPLAVKWRRRRKGP
jgi:uncharacterized iron-regulated membrane protein